MRPSASWASWISGECAQIATDGQWRAIRPFDAAGPAGVLYPAPDADPVPVVSYAGNDYLGLSQHPDVAAAAVDAIDRWGTGSGASRLVVGSRPVHHQLEVALADWKGSERALLFPTGFAANLGLLSTFGHRGAHIHSDVLNHASIIDGCRLARAQTSVFPHTDLDHLANALALDHANHLTSIVVTDAVFSMDGDTAPLHALGELCAETGALLIVDEAHDVFHHAEVLTRIDDLELLRMGTLSKTLGSVGGFVTGSGAAIDLLINRARSFIFTTALPPSDAAAALAALGVERSTEGADLRSHLRSLIDVLRSGHPTPILPVILGSEEAAVDAAATLLAAGALVPAIRPPTVPPGTSRLRIALSAAHTTEQVAYLAGLLAPWTASPPVPNPAVPALAVADSIVTARAEQSGQSGQSE